MYNGRTILQQMQSFISRYEFQKIVNRHDGDKYKKKFSCHNLLCILIFVHTAFKKSLRDICDSLKSNKNYWYHLGLSSISRNNLSHHLSKKPNDMFKELFFAMLQRFRNEKGKFSDKRFRFKNDLKSIDSTTISLCFSLFDWAKFRKKKGGVKIHTIFDNKGQIPTFANITEAKKHDITQAPKFPIEENAIYALDKGYWSYKFLYSIKKANAFFVIRAKTDTHFKIKKRNRKSGENIKADWAIQFSSYKAKNYPDELRLVKYYDKKSKKTYTYLTNNTKLSAKTIADIYKARWDIELFFKWLKQNLKIKNFIGTSENAVKTQIWTALITYLLIEYIRFKSRTSFSMTRTFRLISSNLFQIYSIYNLLIESPPDKIPKDIILGKQLCLNF